MNPSYFIQINNTGSEDLSRILRIPPAVVTVRDAIKRYGQKEWDDMFSFTIVRNPYDRAVSIYTTYLYANKYKMLETNVSFLTFLNNVLKHKQPPLYDKPRFFQSQWEWIRDFNDQQGVVAVGEYEKFYPAVFTILSMMGLDPTGLTLRPAREPNPYKWQKYYEGTEGQLAKGVVQEFWADDFTYLPYEQ